MTPISHLPSSIFRSQLDYTPKLSAVLNLCARFLEAGEQAVIGSAFHDGLDGIARRLDKAGVGHYLLDGRCAPTRRGELAQDFKLRRRPFLLGGVESMAEMHSFPQCNNVVLCAYSWAWDKYEQFINRVHRINSPGPVNVWCVICEGTVDRRLDELRRIVRGLEQHQGFRRTESEVNLADLVHEAAAEFAASAGTTIDERTLEQEWPALSQRLRVGAARWGKG